MATNCVQQLKPLALRSRLMLSDQSCEFSSRKMFEKLIKQTSDLYHYDALLLGFATTRPSHGWCCGDQELEGFLFQEAARSGAILDKCGL